VSFKQKLSHIKIFFFLNFVHPN